ncbi:ATP/GTP-binding protein [Arthrobacter sp. MYb211]|uniref:ATP/GTP-binding protein n=1 Tax=Micrococcaceae TaxID=1268 RepID=UPI000CFBCB17|nr:MULTISPECIES: ATP/GTP-binding protein [unclassified Arthrobacter]PQZ97108.1 ATP/GTP-binding protein [Arthrobacter sp. MYb224]PRA00030.1 ATP/GTP-binding protein [Arthrobacter sp. MYb229]PRA08413.1 ATP/GTP-binding protein [Arthrobacter sp. MYb221]PRB48296.1 ATP/GTP-binding protein [Arthrobacter sp. MYb216]PRC03896.1 ATP/GTP-binding protein [Arthrobacter sp. MYb211]
MPRSNRPRRKPGSAPNARSRSSAPQGNDEDWMQRARYGVVRLQDAPDGQWHVRKVSPLNAVKTYTCPGCHRMITPGVAHLVTWRADHWSGDDAAAANRRHWHPNCWESRSYRY